MDYEALKTELDAGHPVTGAYDADDALAAGELNAVNRTQLRDFVSGSEILNNTNDAEFGALTVEQQARWMSMCGVDSIETGSGVAKSLESELFGGGTTTRANLVAIRVEDISRAEELSLGVIKVGDVEAARTLS